MQKAISEACRNLEGERIDFSEYRFIAKDGSTRYGEVSGAPLLRYGRVAGVVVVARDITERIKAGETLRQSMDGYRALFKNSIEMVYVFDFDGNFLDANPATLSALGYTIEEFR